MIQEKEAFQAEELSRGLDILNSNGQPVIQDQEVKEWIEMAAAIKQSYNQVEPPKELIADMAGRLAAELGEKRGQRHRYWLYGGLIGTAAAVVLAAFSQFLPPQMPDPIVARQAENGSIPAQQHTATIDPPVIPDTAAQNGESISQPVKPDKSETSSVSQPMEEKAPASLPMMIAEIAKAIESPEAEQNPNQVAALEQEMPKDAAANKSIAADGSKIRSQREEKTVRSTEKIAIMLVVPDETAQSVTIDTIHGFIQQVYSVGKRDEITITQRIIDETKKERKMSLKQEETVIFRSSAAVEPSSEKEEVNSITVRIDKYDVTVEGKKSTEDLKKIAESLVARKIKP